MKRRVTYRHYETDTITVKQLAAMLQVGMTKAYGFMKSILTVSDTLGIPGMCHKQDYEAWKKTRLGRTKNLYYEEEKGVDERNRVHAGGSR